MVQDGEPEVDEAAHVAMMTIVRRCQEHLTVEQRRVIEATVEGTSNGTMRLRDFAQLRGTSYEACRRMRVRGIAALSKCVESALVNGGH